MVLTYQQRDEHRKGFFLLRGRVWQLGDLRNDSESWRGGSFRNDIPTFEERGVREAVLNAVSHRAYRSAGSPPIRSNRCGEVRTRLQRVRSRTETHRPAPSRRTR